MPVVTQRVVCADVLDVQGWPHDFEVMVSDPPYSEHVHAKAVSQSRGGGVRSRDLGFGHLTPALRSRIAFWAARVSRWSMVYSDIEGLHDWRVDARAAGAEFIRHIPWVRWSMPQLSGDRPPSGCEMISIYWGSDRGRKSWSGPGNLLALQHTCLRGRRASGKAVLKSGEKQATEKPLDQLLDLLSWFTRPGDRVVDVGAGSGTAGLACRILGRSYVGYEMDPDWAARAAERIGTQRLSSRDQDRYERWMTSHEAERRAMAERRRRYTCIVDGRARAPRESTGGAE